MEADSAMDSAQVGVQFGVSIPLRDGIVLNATVYLLDDECHGPAPTIITLTPYIAQTYHDRGLYFASHGYPFVIVDVRGRGNSQGEFRPLVNEAQDSFDVIEWIAKQPYCDGRVAMWGGSYSGYAQWAAAKQFPPHLATIVPAAAPYAGVDFPGRSQLFAPYLMQWLTLVWGRALQDKMFWGNQPYWGARFRRWFELGAAFSELDEHLGIPSSVFQEWIAHPHRDSYWDQLNPTPDQFAQLSIPVLTITGIYDGDQAGALAYYKEHTSKRLSTADIQHCLIIGPWDHAGTRTPAMEFCGIRVGPASLVDLPKLHLQWYSSTIQGEARPEFLHKNVAYYVLGADKWRYADTLDAVTARAEPLYLQSTLNPTDVFSSGRLDRKRSSGSGPDHYVYDPRDVSLAQLESTIDPESRTDQRMIYASSGKQLVYHSAPFTEDVEISGFFRLSVWLAINQPDTDFRASIYEIGIDGSALQLSFDSMRARYRCSAREPKLVESDDPLKYQFEQFTFVSRRICKGCRLRLVFGPINSIYSQKNYNSGGTVSEESMSDARPVTVRLFHDERYTSALYVPIGQPET